MAIMIPDSLPPRNTDGERITAGERQVFALLQKLPDDCIVYYEPVVRHRHPDFIVILPEAGVLIVEVKGWWYAELKAASPATVALNRRGKLTNEKHPGEQARDYMCLAMDKCRTHSHAHRLLQAGGNYRNRLSFPFGYVSVLSNINRSQLEKGAPELAEIFPPAATITKDQLAAWETLEPEELVARLKSYFDPWWPFPKLTPRQIDVIRGVIHPEVVFRKTDTDLAVLDLRQERNARGIGAGHRVIYGVAGSGKTLLLIARAKLLAEAPEKRILLLCENKQLASYLGDAMRAHVNVTTQHFYKWGVRSGAEFRSHEDRDDYGARLLARLREGGAGRGQFDAVLIDECQDWPCSWFQCAKLALKDPEGGDLLIVGDASQALYRARKFTWAEAGINARGRTVNAKFDLDRNYRNTVEILRAAQPFAAKPKHGQTSEHANVLTLPVDPDKAIRNGPPPAIVELRNPLDECHYAAALIETWLRGGVEIRGRRETVAARDIAVLYPRVRHDAMELLRARLGAFTRSVWVSDKKNPGSLSDDGVRILTVKGSRGLQFRFVVMLWADMLPYDVQTDERGEFYVAMTRAEDVLVILHSGRSTYIDELRGGDGGGGAT